MKDNLKQYLIHPVFEVISKAASDLNTEAYLIGGFVRDIILGNPTKDIDIVTLDSGIELAKKVANHDGKNRKVAVFKNFGTAMLKYDELEIEFVGARRESYPRNSRKPIVEKGTLEEDQLRRDFTINAISVNLQNENFGQLIDPFNGLSDIEEGIIRTPLEPGKTFSDDPLRMMRAIRFATQLHFKIDEIALQAITENRDRIRIVSQERITDELNKIILSDKPSTGFKLLQNTGLLQLVFPELAKLSGVDVKEGMGHKDNFYHTLEVLDNLCLNSSNLWLRWVALLHDIAKPQTKSFSKIAGWTFHGHEDLGARIVPRIFREMKLPLDNKMKYVQKLVRLHLRPIALVKDLVTDSAIRRLLFEAGEDIEELMILCEADITSKNERKVKQYLANFRKVRLKLVEVEKNDRLRNWQPPVSGEDIMKSFDIKPCREIGIIKTAIREAILDGEIKNNYDEAFSFMLKKGEDIGLKYTQEKK